jgi:nitroreductase
MDEPLAALLSEAVRAPSGDNTQPWRFTVDLAVGTIALDVDESRDPSPMNAGQRMARIAVGAAIENLLRAAKGRGWIAELEKDPGTALAVVHLSRTGVEVSRGQETIRERVTNRRPYDRRAVPPDVLDRLVGETPDLEAIGTRWIVGPDRLEAIAPLIGRADALMFGEPSMLRAFLSKVRLDAAREEAVADGLSPSSLELTSFDRLALKTMASAPDWLLKLGGAPRVFASKARALVSSASGMCLVVAPDDTPQTDVQVGRAMQQAWLALTSLGLAAQPMMSLPVLENAIEHGDQRLVDALGRGKVEALGKEFRDSVPEVGAGRPAWLMRFGYAPPPTGRTGRLPIDAVTTYSRRIREGVS